MNQQCKVCGEPAAGFHFGAFTCEGCKSFFGRSYNNLNSITECKNNGECIINKKNRTACKSCRLRKCLLVGMSKSGSRYGRRSNWFKIHCLLQEQQQAAVAQLKEKNSSASPLENSLPLLSPIAFPHSNLGTFLRTNNPSSPSVSSPDSDSSEPGPYSPRMNGTNNFVNKDFYLPVPFQSMFMPPPTMTSPFLLPPSLLPFPVPPTKRCDYTQRLLSPNHVQNLHKKSSTPDLAEEDRVRSNSPPSQRSPTNNNVYSSKYINNKLNNCDDFKNKCNNNNNFGIYNKNIEAKSERVTVRSTRFYLDAILGLKDVSDNDSESQNEKTPEGNEEEGQEEREKIRFGKFPLNTSEAAKLNGSELDIDFNGEEKPEEQDNPIDLSIKNATVGSETKLLKNCCLRSVEIGDQMEKEVDDEDEREIKPNIYKNNEELKPLPLDLTV